MNYIIFCRITLCYNERVKKKYDLIFGFGPACSCSQAIRRAGLQYLSFPFDWITPTFGQPGWDDDVRRRTDIVCSEFRDWLLPNDFSFHGHHTNGKDKYFNTRHGLMFLHDFPEGVPLAESFPAVAVKYHRRCARLLELIRRSRNVLIVRIDRPDLDYRTPVDDCRYARRMLAERFAPANFDFILLQEDASIPRDECQEEQIEDGLLRLSLDYRNLKPGADIMQPDTAITAAALRTRFTVSDYRTGDERAAWAHTRKMKRYARYGAANAFQYHWRRLKAALGGNGTGNA